MRLTPADVVAWLFTCHPREFVDMLPRLRAGGSGCTAGAWTVVAEQLFTSRARPVRS